MSDWIPCSVVAMLVILFIIYLIDEWQKQSFTLMEHRRYKEENKERKLKQQPKGKL